MLFQLLASFSSLLNCVSGLATHSSDIAPISRDVISARDMNVDFARAPVWTIKDLDLSISAIRAGAPNTQVAMAVIASNTIIAGVLCTIDLVGACIAGAAIAVITNFYLVYDILGNTDSPVRCIVAGISANIHDLW